MKSILSISVLAAVALAWAGDSAVPSSYTESILAWQKHRETGLRSPNGWLTLAGLFWLAPGKTQTIGSAGDADFVLPQSAPPQVGKLLLADNNVTFTNLGGGSVTVDNRPVTAPIILSFDEENPSLVRAGSVSFFVIHRGDRFAIRAKDADSRVLKSFTGSRFYPISPDLHFADAKLIPDVKKIPILNVVGQTDMEESPGVVEFSYKGATYHLRPIYEGKSLFFLFKDPTNKTETYPAGRMLNTPLPVNGKVDLDFNRSYNPPCTFTPYATCPLPPKENVLAVPVTAGELRYGKGHPEL
jgi:uncharacterized protein (DUF1684 family)